MPDTPRIARLTTHDLRDAWPHEALDFTRWLFENLGFLGEAIGIELQGEQREVGVGSFCADILATNARDGSRVLIENQLERSDHDHAGKIMTYLAGLEAKTVIWVAKQIRDEHRAAIRWLNDHTTEEHSFFAVELRVVRIANSPFAPLFDVVERPNGWERRARQSATERETNSAVGDSRAAFWVAYCARFRDEVDRSGPPTRASNRNRTLNGIGLVISRFLSDRGVGIYVRGLSQKQAVETQARLAAHAGTLEARLGVELGRDARYCFSSELEGDFNDAAQFERLASWLHATTDTYEQVFGEVLDEGRSSPSLG